MLTSHPADGVVGRLNRDEAVPEAGQARRGQCDRLGVAVDAHDLQGRKALKRRLGVAPHAQGAVDHDWLGRACRRRTVSSTLDGGGEQVQAALKEHRLVPANGVGSGCLRL